VNTENQSQRVVFEVVNPAGRFRIGENVRVLKYGSNRIGGLVIPTTAITDVNGKPPYLSRTRQSSTASPSCRKAKAMRFILPLSAVLKPVNESLPAMCIK
jgi:hypothetical protein